MQHSENKPTQSPLLYLLRCQSEDAEQLYHDLYQDSFHGRRNLRENPQAAEIVFETVEEIHERIITRANSFRGLMELGCHKRARK